MFDTPFRDRLCHEFESRKKRNARYSIRAFAAFLRTDHSTLSQILRGTRRVPANRVNAWAKKLGVGDEEIAFYVAAESMPHQVIHARNEQLRNWIAEAASIAREPVHFQILELSRTANFRADSRWIALQLNVSVDDVNVAFSRLLRLRLIAADRQEKWTDLTGIQRLNQKEFLGVALTRVREGAIEFSTKPLVK